MSDGESSREAQAATELGLSVEVATDAQWTAKTQDDFDNYKALVIGDPTCSENPDTVAAAQTNASTWGPAVTGNAIVIGTDPTFHSKFGFGEAGAQKLIKQGIGFAASEAGKTGAYVTLSCYYHNSSPNTPVPLLDGFSPGGFTAASAGNCFNDAHITATHPALDTLTDADLSDWSCSVHEVLDKWPDDWEVLAIAENSGSAYTAPDGTVGSPYILARGEDLVVISDIKLAPESQQLTVGDQHTLTATVSEDGTPTANKEVSFKVTEGPHAGTTGTGTTDTSGNATFAYPGTTAGTDTIEATFEDSAGKTQTSNKVTAEWAAKPAPTCEIGEIRPPVNDVSNATDTDNMSAYKQGSRGSVPAKFEVRCDGNLVDTAEKAAAHPMVLTLTRLASGTDPDADLEPTVTGSANTGKYFRYAGGFYIYNIGLWDENGTKRPKGTYRITISEATDATNGVLKPDGATHSEWFQIK